MIAETLGRLATIAFGIVFELLALQVYWKAAEAASPFVIVLSILLAAGGLVLVARGADRLTDR